MDGKEAFRCEGFCLGEVKCGELSRESTSADWRISNVIIIVMQTKTEELFRVLIWLSC